MGVLEALVFTCEQCGVTATVSPPEGGPAGWYELGQYKPGGELDEYIPFDSPDCMIAWFQERPLPPEGERQT